MAEKPSTPLGVRWAFLCVGLFGVALGYVGLVVPGLPSTVFFLLALWGFKRSSPRFEKWLVTKSPAKGFLRDWSEDRSMTVRSKVLAISFLWISIGISLWILVGRGRDVWLPVVVAVAGVVGTIVILRVKTKRTNPSRC